VTFFENLPGNVTDKARERSKKEFSFFHELGLRVREGDNSL